MAASDGTIDVSTGAQAAIKSAMDGLQAYKGEPRVAALISKLATIADPEGDAGVDEQQLSKSLEDVVKLEKSEDVSESVRKRAGEARLDLERAYLARMSPTGSARWEEAARMAGRAS